jgi:hypothetical protein
MEGGTMRAWTRKHTVYLIGCLLLVGLGATAAGQTIASLPDTGEGFLALISVSSAVFLGGKALPPLMLPRAAAPAEPVVPAV